MEQIDKPFLCGLSGWSPWRRPGENPVGLRDDRAGRGQTGRNHLHRSQHRHERKKLSVFCTSLFSPQSSHQTFNRFPCVCLLQALHARLTQSLERALAVPRRRPYTVAILSYALALNDKGYNPMGSLMRAAAPSICNTHNLSNTTPAHCCVIFHTNNLPRRPEH